MPKRVLIIDDERFVRRLLQHVFAELEPGGVEIHCAEDGDEGIERARALRPDLVLLDFMMPGRDGLSVCRDIRRDPALRGTHVIVLTARGQIPAVPPEEAPHEFLTKPFDPDRLLARAAEILGVSVDLDA